MDRRIVVRRSAGPGALDRDVLRAIDRRWTSLVAANLERVVIRHAHVLRAQGPGSCRGIAREHVVPEPVGRDVVGSAGYVLPAPLYRVVGTEDRVVGGLRVEDVAVVAGEGDRLAGKERVAVVES